MSLRRNRAPRIPARWPAVPRFAGGGRGGSNGEDGIGGFIFPSSASTVSGVCFAAMESRIEASRQRVLQSDAFPDPEVEVGIRDLPVSSPSLTRDDMTMEMVSARQTIPGAGKRAARRASALFGPSLRKKPLGS